MSSSSPCERLTAENAEHISLRPAAVLQDEIPAWPAKTNMSFHKGPDPEQVDIWGRLHSAHVLPR